jgi:hypothetical protein
MPDFSLTFALALTSEVVSAALILNLKHCLALSLLIRAFRETRAAACLSLV